MKEGKVNVLLDGQWGSTGKGKLAGYLALKHDLNVIACDFQTNAGHTFRDGSFEAIVHQIPSGFVNKDAILAVTPGASITLDYLFREIEMFQDYDIANRLVIHPNAMVITEEHAAEEGRSTKFIASTMKGCGAALAAKTMRKAKLAKDEPKLDKFIGDTSSLIIGCIKAGGTVLAEGAQGFDLSINHGTAYPFVTSRDVTTCSILNNCGVPPTYVGDVYGSLRTFPIRVGNVIENGVTAGYSGPWHAGQKELTWKELELLSGSEKSLSELTTVTKRVRRVFTWSPVQFRRFLDMCGPTHLFVNFINHINASDYGKRLYSDLSVESKDWLRNRGKELESFGHPETRVTHIGTGPDNADMVEC